jgi:hypothetical protein
MKFIVGLALPAMLAGPGLAAAERSPFPQVSALPLRPGLPDPLEMLDGRKVTSAREWKDERRPELKALFQHYMYGYFPAAPGNLRATAARINPGLFGGKAIRKELSLSFGPPGCPPIDLLLVVPAKRSGPVPVILGLNFTGNHSLLTDPKVTLTRSWMRDGPGVVAHRATEEGRGTKIGTWAIEQSIDRGYAVATFHYGDVLPDKPDFHDGIYPHYLKPGQVAPDPTDWGAIACWAWGLQRAVDYLVTDPDVDRERIAVMGHSRNGKAALLAAAFDERIALVIPHQAGCGGTAPSRTKNPKAETVQAINDGFPHWFNDVFPQFNGQVGRLPFDQHCLIALVAPRAVFFTNGVEDQWADPAGQFELLRAADPVYRLLGAEGLGVDEAPPLGKSVGSRLGYYLRSGGHVTDPEYWSVFLDFADRHLKPGDRTTSSTPR